MASAGQSYAAGSKSISFTSTDIGGYVRYTYYRVDGGAQKTYSSPFVIAALQGVSRTAKVEFWSVDCSGNSEAHKTALLPIGPRVELSASSSLVTYPSPVTFTAVASDVAATVAYLDVAYGVTGTSIGSWNQIETTDSPTGTFVFSAQVPSRKAYYRVRVGTVSATTNVSVKSLLGTPTSSALNVDAGELLTFSGTISPSHPIETTDQTYRVYFSKYDPLTSTWAKPTYTVAHIDSLVDTYTSTWSYARTFGASESGLWTVQFYHVCPRHAAAYSPKLGFSVGRLNASTLPIVSYGAKARVAGSLLSTAGVGLEARTVVLRASSSGSRWSTVATSTTGVSGRYTLYSAALTSARYLMVSFAGSATEPAAATTKMLVKPRAYVTNPYAPASAYRSRSFSVFVYLKPRHTAGNYPVRIYRYRWNGTRWVSYGYVSARASNYSSYTKCSRSMSLPYRGRWRLRAYAPADAGHAATWSSGCDYVTVK